MIDRLSNAQTILTAMSNYRIELKRGRVVYSCNLPNGKKWSKQWQSVSQGSFYAKWRPPYHGGTFEVCLAQLARYVTGKPHLPMGWWKRAVSVGMAKEVLDAAMAAKWPESFPCVHCGKELITGYDWWSLDGVEGIICWNGDCRKKEAAK